MPIKIPTALSQKVTSWPENSDAIKRAGKWWSEHSVILSCVHHHHGHLHGPNQNKAPTSSLSRETQFLLWFSSEKNATWKMQLPFHQLLERRVPRRCFCQHKDIHLLDISSSCGLPGLSEATNTWQFLAHQGCLTWQCNTRKDKKTPFE